MIPKLHGEYLRTRRRRRESLHSVHPDSLVDIHELSPDEVVIHSFIPKCEVTVTQSRPWNRCLPQTARGWVQDGAVDNSVDRLQALALLTELQREFAVTIADVDLDAPAPGVGNGGLPTWSSIWPACITGRPRRPGARTRDRCHRLQT